MDCRVLHSRSNLTRTGVKLRTENLNSFLFSKHKHSNAFGSGLLRTLNSLLMFAKIILIIYISDCQNHSIDRIKFVSF